MKKFFILPFAMAAAVSAYAAGITGTLAELNQELVSALVPFQSETTAARVVFNKIETNAEHALAAGVEIFYKKTGTQNTLEVNVPELSYNYGDGSAPTTTLSGAAKLDLTKVMSQEDLNDMIPNAEAMIMDLSASLTGEYGEAVTVVVNITEKNQDSAGNYVSLKGNISFTIDLSKLPANVKAEDVPVLRGSADIGLDLKIGVVINANVVSNPAYAAFQQNNRGLKEYLESLLARNPGMIEEFKGYVQQLDDFAKSIVDGNQ